MDTFGNSRSINEANLAHVDKSTTPAGPTTKMPDDYVGDTIEVEGVRYVVVGFDVDNSSFPPVVLLKMG